MVYRNKKRPSFFYYNILSLFFYLCVMLLLPSSMQALPPSHTLLPIGGSYTIDTLTAFATQVVARDSDGVITLRVLPITYASDPFNITPGERAANLATAQARANEILAACNSLVSPPDTCEVTVPDIQVQNDANNAELVNTTLDSSVDGVFILGGDQTIAMQVVANSLAEVALASLYNSGVPLGGTSAGAGVQSRYMIAGYNGSNGAAQGLRFDAVNVWYGDLTGSMRGLSFGLNTAVIEQHTLERGRLARLLQATQRLPDGTPHLGIGVDGESMAQIADDQTVGNFAGAYAAVVVDEESYGAAATAVYTTPAQLLSIHNVGLHVFPTGSYSYDLTSRQPVVNSTPLAAPDITNRNFEVLNGPDGSGVLLVAGDLSTSMAGSVVNRFVALAQTSSSPTIVLATGYSSDITANMVANDWADQLTALGVDNVLPRALVDSSNLITLATELNGAGAIFVVGDNQQGMAGRVDELGVINLANLWRNGKIMLLDNAAAPLAGSWMSSMPSPTPANLEIQSSDSFLVGNVTIQPALAFLSGVVFEPRLLTDYRYGRLVSHIHQHNNLITVGIEPGTALEITPSAVTVMGEGAVVVIDGRYAQHIGNGNNNAIAAAWLLLDTFTPGEFLVAADPTHIHLSRFTASQLTSYLPALLVILGLVGMGFGRLINGLMGIGD